jgi:protein-tyrosine phosphatase
LVQRGVVVQVTVGSLLGEAGQRTKETAQRLLRRGLVHVLASDGHAATGERCPLLTPGVEVAARVVGLARAQAMVTEVPQRILDGSWEPEGDRLPAP